MNTQVQSILNRIYFKPLEKIMENNYRMYLIEKIKVLLADENVQKQDPLMLRVVGKTFRKLELACPQESIATILYAHGITGFESIQKKALEAF